MSSSQVFLEVNKSLHPHLSVLNIVFHRIQNLLRIGDSLIAAEWMYHPYHFEMYQS